jgi:hypothetical protein
MKLNFPGGKQLIDTPGPAVGREVKADTSRAGHVDNGLLAWPERLATALKYWPEGGPRTSRSSTAVGGGRATGRRAAIPA